MAIGKEIKAATVTGMFALVAAGIHTCKKPQEIYINVSNTSSYLAKAKNGKPRMPLEPKSNFLDGEADDPPPSLRNETSPPERISAIGRQSSTPGIAHLRHGSQAYLPNLGLTLSASFSSIDDVKFATLIATMPDGSIQKFPVLSADSGPFVLKGKAIKFFIISLDEAAQHMTIQATPGVN